MTGKNVFIIGPGLIGWSVLDLLSSEDYNVSGLVRREAHGAQIARPGATPIQGDLNDHDLIVEYVIKKDITVHTATADHLLSVLAVLDGIKTRAASGKSTIYIHTSGTSILDDNSNGSIASSTIYTDTDPAAINALPDTAMHRNIDLAILSAQQSLGEKAKIAVMIPPLIYGINPLHKRLSIQVPTLARFALKHGFSGHIGPGLSVESQIHVLDLARGYIVLLHHMESSPLSTFLANPYFFCENGQEYSWREVAEQVGKALYDKGLIADKQPRELEQKHWEDLFGEWTGAVLGLNSRSRAVRLRELGWECREKGIWESFAEDELELILGEDGVGKTSRYAVTIG